VIVLSAAIFVGCSGTKEVLNCPPTHPVVVEVPVPVADSTLVSFRAFLGMQTPPITLDGLTDSTSTTRIAEASLIENYYWRGLWRDINQFLFQITDSEGNPLFP
jgi:hypothetical protein